MICLDTNVLAYAEGVDDAVRKARARQTIAALPGGTAIIPVQVLGELFRVLTIKAKRPVSTARERLLSWSDAFAVRDTSATAFLAAMDLAADHKLSIWDAIIMAVAAEAGCRLLLSEDLHEGFTWRGVTVANPFAPVLHPLLVAVLEPGALP
jgi:predicted nucleic acid-binding protein